MSLKRFYMLMLLVFSLFSCATLPKPLQDIPALRDVSLKVLKENPDRYKDISVLWGGRITNCINTQDGTVFEILYFNLDKEGYPEETDISEGRFIVKSKNFLDCDIYSKGRLITVVGRFKELQDGKIDTMPYTFAVIEAQATYLWKKKKYNYWHPQIWLWYGHPSWWFEYGFGRWW